MAQADSANTTTASIADAHALLVLRVINNKPDHMPNWCIASSFDFEDMAEHLRRLLVDVETYVAAAVRDIASKSAVRIDTDVGGCISDMRGDVVGTLLNAAEDMREGRAA